MNLVLAQTDMNLPLLLVWGLGLGAIGLALRLTPRLPWRKVGTVVAVIGLILIGIGLPPLGNALPQMLFWLMAAVAVVSSGAAVTSRSPVYAAIWFAVSLLGTAGLFLLQGAYFLGVATIVVYAGAIVVTFLFVLMLAQPKGNAAYDRISWAGFATPVAVIGTALLIGIMINASPKLPPVDGPSPVLDDGHVALLGTELFARHLVSVEVAGTLLLVALVGAIVVVIQGKPRRTASTSEGVAER